MSVGSPGRSGDQLNNYHQSFMKLLGNSNRTAEVVILMAVKQLTLASQSSGLCSVPVSNSLDHNVT